MGNCGGKLDGNEDGSGDNSSEIAAGWSDGGTKWGREMKARRWLEQGDNGASGAVL